MTSNKQSWVHALGHIVGMGDWRFLGLGYSKDNRRFSAERCDVCGRERVFIEGDYL